MTSLYYSINSRFTCSYVPEFIETENFPLCSSDLNQSGWFFTLESFAAKAVSSTDRRHWSSEAQFVTLLSPISHDTIKGAPNQLLNKKLISRWESERELFNDHIVHVLQNTINSCINSATGRRSSSQSEVKHQNKERNGKVKLKR